MRRPRTGGAHHGGRSPRSASIIAKSVFQVHGVDARGNAVVRRQLKRRYVLAYFKKLPPFLVGIEACATSHHWSRELQALGHNVRLIPPVHVKPERQTPQERCGRRRGDLRGGAAAEHALRADQDIRSAKLPDVCIVRGISSSGSRPRSSTRSAQSGRVRHCCSGRAQRCRGVALRHRRSRGTSASRRWREHVSKLWVCCSANSRLRSWSSTDG